jgi:phosphoglycolate phosphatase
MKFKSVIFDLDGTLLNTLEDIAVSANCVLRGRGFGTHPLDAYRYFVGSGATELMIRALPPGKRDKELILDCVEAFRIEYRRNWNIKTRPYNGVLELLAHLAEKRVRIAVLSNKPHKFTALCVRQYFAGYDFAAVLGEGEGVPLKPDPSGALEITRRLGIPPAEFVFVGDTGIDMETAVRAGMFPLGALWGFRPEKELIESGAVETITRPMDMLLFVK